MSDGFSNPNSDKSNLFGDQHLNGQSRSIVVGRGTGKRFARRAKRWADLQQRRYNQRIVALRNEMLSYSESRSSLFDSYEATPGVMKEEDVLMSASNLEHLRQSLSCWISQPYCRGLSGHCSISSLGTSLVVSTASFKYPTQKNFSNCQLSSDSIYSPVHNPRFLNQRCSHCAALMSNTDLNDLLSLITHDLSVTSTHGANISLHESVHHVDKLSMHLPLNSYFAGSKYTVNTAPPPEREWVMIRHADPDRPIGMRFTLIKQALILA
ncbi:unnamed protein product [Strongylus vulgaris]|uniref:Uncharacterized protein n=1 Tax=Strongylus vulgaris TaxID=40348 RepID=A0A3P7IEA9_STRVU|nr:unnamed protein product [Strongylus vulgaris]